MNSTSVEHRQKVARARLLHAAILSAPLWAAAALFLAVLFSLMHDASYGSLQVVALSLVVMLGSTIVALHVMDRDSPRVKAKHALERRIMKIRSRRLRGVRQA